jgi:uncharacterized repeat protein (TIGR02543 family)
MKKITLGLLTAILLLTSISFIPQTVSAQQMSIVDFVNLLIAIGVIPQDKVPAVNIWLASLPSTPTTPPAPTPPRSGGGGGGGGGSNSRSYNVFYNGNGNTGGTVPTDSTNYRRNTTVTVLGNTNSLTKTGYSFFSWNTQADGLGSNYFNSSSFNISADVTLYAKWIATYSVTYDGNGNTAGTAPTDSSLYSSDVSVSISNPGDLVKSGYVFDGWNTASDGSGYSYSASSTATIFIYESNVTLYAQWEIAPNLSVSEATSNPDGEIVGVEDDQSTDDVQVLHFKLEAGGSDVNLNQITLDLRGSFEDENTTLNDLISSLDVEIDGTSFTSASVSSSSQSQTLVVDLDDDFLINEDNEVTIRVSVDVNGLSGNFAQGDSLTVDFVSARGEDSYNNTVDSLGTINGNEQVFVSDGYAELSSKTFAVLSEIEGDGPGEEDTYRANFTFIIHPLNDDINLPLDSFAYGTAGDSGIEYTVSGDAEVISAYITSDASEMINTYSVAEGDVESFTISVVLKGNNSNGKVTINSIWYEKSDVLPDGDNKITWGLDDFETQNLYLAK